MKIRRFIWLFFIGFMACNAPKKETGYKQIEYNVWGTKCSIIYKENDSVNVKDKVKLIFDSLSNSISTYNKSSLLSRINNNQTDSIDAIILQLMEQSKFFYKISNGMFDPTIQPITNKWGFLTQNGKWIDTAELPAILNVVGLDKWQWDSTIILAKPKGARIDFNAIAPGYAADCIAEYFKSIGIKDFFINNGGEIVLSGSRPNNTPWKVGVVSPARKDNKHKGDTLYTISNTALATSGSYNNKFTHEGVEYSHTISPKSGLPIQSNLISATVIAKNATHADAHATICMTKNKEEALAYLEEQKLEGYLIFKNKEGFISRVMIP